MQPKYQPETVDNFISSLDVEDSLYLVSLCLASNDLVLNLDAIGNFHESENSYFFYSSIAIVREIAHLVIRPDKSNISQKFSRNTAELLRELKEKLAPFNDESLVKSVLKPIRDMTFHYDFAGPKYRSKFEAALQNLREQKRIEIGIAPDQHSPLGHKYTFADKFRSECVNSFLSEEVVPSISTISAGVVAFVDSLMADLVGIKSAK